MTTMAATPPTCVECHELRRVRSYPPDPKHPDLRSVSTSTTLAEHEDTDDSDRKPLSFLKVVRPLLSLFYLLAFSSTFTVLNCLFVYFVLLRQYVETPGHIMWDGPKTNVSISSRLK